MSSKIKSIEAAIAWQEHVKAQSKDPQQRKRCDDAIMRLMYQRREEIREIEEVAETRGALEQAAWYDTSKELD